MTHLLVTNDFPPKVGGIQSYLWELWRRLPPDRFKVVTASSAEYEAFDNAQPFRTIRLPQAVLLPTPNLSRRLRAVAAEMDAGLVVIDPALPLGLLGAGLGPRYGVVLHGAEVTVPGRLPGGCALLRRVLRGAGIVVAAGGYALREAERAAGCELPAVVVPPGVDTYRFRPLPTDLRAQARSVAGLPADGRLVLSVSRLVPRKGMDVLIAAAALLARDRPDLTLAIAGEGRDLPRLERLAAASGARVHFLGRVPDEQLPELVASADVFAMMCRNRWAGLEQEGFGIVFLEAAACGVPQVAGDSGGAADAVVDGVTGFVVRRPEDPVAAAAALGALLDDPDLRARQGASARARAEDEFSYDRLAAVLDRSLAGAE